ncbi:MAG: hypothetical protein AAFY28_15910, partial [Actinomycetota bacterium]
GRARATGTKGAIMYIFSSALQAKPGHGAIVRDGALQLASVLASAGADGTTAWQGMLGVPYGAFLVSGRFDSVADYADASTTMQQDPAFAEISATLGPALAAPADVYVSQIVAAGTNYAQQPFVSVTRAVVAAGQMSAAMQWSTEFLEFAEAVTGEGGLLTRNVGGRVGDIGFIFAAPDAEAWQARDAKLAADPGYVARLDQTEGLFEPGSDQQVLMSAIS